MNKTIASILAVTVLALSQMGGCATTGSDLLNNPATQAEISALETIGTTALNNWISSQVTKGRHENKEQFIADQTARAAKLHPKISRAKIRATIEAKLADK